MYYYDDNDNDRRSKRTGALAALAYFALLAVVLLVVKISHTVHETGEGMLIAFGDTDAAGGSMMPSPVAPSVAGQQNVAAPEQMTTQDFEQAPPVAATEETVQQTVAPPVEEPRRPDQRALFPGRAGETSDSQGASEGAGQQGAQDGSPDADPAGTGAGAGGTSFSLDGRSIVGSLPAPRYPSNKSGRVVVEITVDGSGRVIRAVPRGQGSTTNDSELIDAALEAARRARFNVVETDGLQTGTITYNFTLT